MKPLYRQGDVLIMRVAKPVSTKFETPETPVILAHGEATGHAHTIAGVRQLWRDGSELILRIDAPQEVRHQEHAPIKLPPGTYRVRRQREYTPEAIRNVAD